MSAKVRREREAPELAAGIRRQIVGLRQRVGTGDLDSLRELVGLVDELRTQIDLGYAAADVFGYDHRTIGGETGVSKQAAQQRVARGRQIAADTVAVSHLQAVAS